MRIIRDSQNLQEPIDTEEHVGPADRVPDAWLAPAAPECECPSFCLLDHDN